MAYDLNVQPKTEAEFTEYFFTLIGEKLGGKANNFKTLLMQEFPWNGQMLRIPENVPGPGQQLPANAPFYGLTQQTGGDHIPDARLWIPAAQPDVDENGNLWYTRYIQYVEDTPGGVHGVDYIWAWTYKSGHEYVPLAAGGTVPPPVDYEARFAAIEARLASLEDRVTELENKPGSPWPNVVAIQSVENQKYVAAEVASNKALVARSAEIGPWEKFNLIIIN